MTDNDGLSGGPVLPPRPAPAPRHDDLSIDTVRDSLANTASNHSDAVQPWAKALATSAKQGGPPSFRTFDPSGPNPLKPVESMFEKAIGSDPTTGGFLKGMGNYLLTAVGQPVTGFTDEYQVAKIRELQKKFLEDHDYTLRQLSEDLGRAKVNMRLLANMLDDTSFGTGKLDQIMKEKKEVGDHERLRIQDALDNTKDPEARKKLQAMKDDMDKWTVDRDQRLKAEQPAVDTLHGKMDKLNDQVLKQRDSMRAAADSSGPSNLTGSDGKGGPNRVLESSHVQPDAAMHAATLHNFLLRSRSLLGV